MLHLALRKRFCLEFGKNLNYQLRYAASRTPLKTIPKDETINNETDDLRKSIESIAVPVISIPTIDSSKRHPTPLPIIVAPITPALIDDSEIVTTENKKNVERKEWNITPSQDRSKLLKYYLKLSKSRLTSLVVITSMAGYAMAPAPFDLGTFILCSIGTGLTSAAANSINQYHEVPFDSQMSRTKNRVLVTGLLTPLHAVGFALTSATIGITMLNYGCNGLTASLALGNLILYTSIYTPMKRFSILNTWVGSIVGAIPPLMGWAACAGHLDIGAWILSGLLYAWQFPHFNALSWNLRPDYSRAGYYMMAVTNPGLCRRTALRYTIVLGGLSLAAPYYDVTNMWFALETLPLNAYFIYLAWKFYQKSDSGSSRKLFRFSLIHLPALMILFLLNKKRWIFAEQTTVPLNAIAAEITSTTDTINKQFITPEKLNLLPNSQPISTQILPIAASAATESLPRDSIKKSSAVVINSAVNELPS